MSYSRSWSSPGLSWCKAQPFLWVRSYGLFTQLFLWCSAQCSPTGALVQLGGVLALHVPHVVLRGPLPIENEQLLGLPITLILLYLKNMTGPTTL